MIQRASQICLRLKRLLPNRDEQFVEKNVRESAQGARWLRRVVECYSDDLEVEYEDTLDASGLPEGD